MQFLGPPIDDSTISAARCDKHVEVYAEEQRIYNKFGRAYSFESTEIPRVFFTPALWMITSAGQQSNNEFSSNVTGNIGVQSYRCINAMRVQCYNNATTGAKMRIKVIVAKI
jgi:hypothetical protein